jgi:hypothetical protein
LVSSETATWLGNHFKVSLSQIKPIIDESFVAGVNHIFYHGTPYTPPSEPYPGWLFYASTNFNYNSHFWNELPYLNRYVTEVQTELQSSRSDQDVLLYLPMYDIWHTPGKSSKTHAIDVHSIYRSGPFDSTYLSIINDLKSGGYSFDFISDRQILKSKFEGEIITEGGASYQVIVIPLVSYFSLHTLKKLADLKSKGAKIIFLGKLPDYVNGFFNYKERQLQFKKILSTFQHIALAKFSSTMASLDIRKESMAQNGLSYIRKKSNENYIYFITNQTNNDLVKKIKLSCNPKSLIIKYPMTGKVIHDAYNKDGVLLEILAGESIIIKTSEQSTKKKPSPKKTKEHTIFLNNKWKLEFIDGKPDLPSAMDIDELQSWTLFEDNRLKNYMGTGRYTTSLELKDSEIGLSATLCLGNVRESARVVINGHEIGNLWALPFNIEIPKGILRASNTIEIYVKNNAANYIRYIDKNQMVNWKKFYDINMVDIRYKPFDASNWKDEDAGLLGPVYIKIR